MSKFSLNLPEELDRYVDAACLLSGRSRNAACVDWILRGALDELARFEKAEATLRSFGANPLSTPNEPNFHNSDLPNGNETESMNED